MLRKLQRINNFMLENLLCSEFSFNIQGFCFMSINQITHTFKLLQQWFTASPTILFCILLTFPIIIIAAPTVRTAAASSRITTHRWVWPWRSSSSRSGSSSAAPWRRSSACSVTAASHSTTAIKQPQGLQKAWQRKYYLQAVYQQPNTRISAVQYQHSNKAQDSTVKILWSN